MRVGGFVVNEKTEKAGENAFYKKSSTSKAVDVGKKNSVVATLPFRNSAELLELCRRENMTIGQVVYENERRWRTDAEIRRNLLEIWRTMDSSIINGCWSTEEKLPGPLNINRRAPALFKRLMQKSLVRAMEEKCPLSFVRSFSPRLAGCAV